MDLPALARLLSDTATAQSSNTGHQAVVATALAAAALVRRRRTLLVLHLLLTSVAALGVSALGRTIVALRGTVVTLRRAVALKALLV